MARAQQPFDQWLQRQLHDLYDSITQEPLPDDLVKLVSNELERPPGGTIRLRPR